MLEIKDIKLKRDELSIIMLEPKKPSLSENIKVLKVFLFS